MRYTTLADNGTPVLPGPGPYAGGFEGVRTNPLFVQAEVRRLLR